MSKLNIVPLASLASNSGAFVDGPFGSNLKASEYVDKGIPVLRLQNVRPNKYDPNNLRFITEVKAANLHRHSYKAGDVVITKLGEPCGVACQIPENTPSGVIVADVVRFRGDSSRIDHRYLVHFLNSLDGQRQVSQLVKGTTRQRVNLTDFKKLQIPLPSLEEQRRIAAILDKADAVRWKRQQAIALTEELLRSAFLEMFGDPATNLKGWEMKPLVKVVQSDTIITYGIVQAGPHIENGIPYVRTGDIKNDQIIEPGLLRTSPDIAKKYKRSEVYAGDIVISIRATVGTTARVPASLHGANLTQGTAKISPGPDTDGNYLLWFIRSNGCQDWIQRQVKGATFREITLERLRSMPVMLPPLDLQSKFGKIVNQTIQCTRKLELAKGNEEDLFNSLLQRAFRREL